MVNEIDSVGTIRDKVFCADALRNLIIKPSTLFTNDSDKKNISDLVFDSKYDNSFFLVNKSIGSNTKIITVKLIDDEYIDTILA